MLYAFCAKIRMNFPMTETLSDFLRIGVTAEVRILQGFERKGTKIYLFIFIFFRNKTMEKSGRDHAELQPGMGSDAVI